MTYINPGRTALSEQPRSLPDSQIYDIFWCVCVEWKSRFSVWVGQEEREVKGKGEDSDAAG